MGTARDYKCTQLHRGGCIAPPIVRTGMLWPSLVRWLVILIGRDISGGGSTVGACQWGGSGEHVRASSQEIRGHRAQPSLGVGRWLMRSITDRRGVVVAARVPFDVTLDTFGEFRLCEGRSPSLLPPGHPRLAAPLAASAGPLLRRRDASSPRKEKGVEGAEKEKMGCKFCVATQ